MKFYQVIIRPESGFGTPLKGDTLFGHFCWQIRQDPALVDNGLDTQLARYQEAPFAVFSSAFSFVAGQNAYILKRPDMPLDMIFAENTKGGIEALKQNKENKSKKWMQINGPLIEFSRAVFMTDAMACAFMAEHAEQDRSAVFEGVSGQLKSQGPLQHNTINRLTGTTGSGVFAPYEQEAEWFMPGLDLVIFVLVDESVTDIERIHTGLRRIGKWGFGRDASIGLGRFQVTDTRELEPVIPCQCAQDAFYTLSPAVLPAAAEKFADLYFKPFVRFGKHGDILATGHNPFKNPVIMADEAAVFVPKDKKAFDRPYIGKAVTGISKALPKTVSQGYTPFFPLTME